MIDYSRWKEKTLTVTYLKLDPYNPRIPEAGIFLDQRDLIADLIENDRVYELAKSIVENGYYPVESLIVIEKNGQKCVIEGNRRLAACKVLISPQSAPENWEKKFRALSNRIDPKSISKVKVLIAPSREAAAPVIMSKHTSRQIEKWSPLMQDKFFKNLLEGGFTVTDLAEQYSLQPKKILEALQRYTMYSIACTLDLPEDIRKVVHNPRGFPITNLERLYENNVITDFLGISFDENKNLIGKIDIKEFKKGYSKIITDIATGAVTSRYLNTYEAQKKYLDDFGDKKPDLRKKGSFTAKTLLETAVTQEKTTAVSRRISRKRKKSQALIPDTISCTVVNQRINSVFDELQKLSVPRYPNAVGLMLRCLLEMSLGYYLERTGHLERLINNIQKKKKNILPKDWHPTLLLMLKYTVSEKSNIIRNPNLIKSLDKLISQKEKIISIDTLNLFAHNEHFYPDEDTLRNFWNHLQGLFEIILIEPDGDEESE